MTEFKMSDSLLLGSFLNDLEKTVLEKDITKPVQTNPYGHSLYISKGAPNCQSLLKSNTTMVYILSNVVR